MAHLKRMRTRTASSIFCFATCLSAAPVFAGDPYSEVITVEVRPGWTQPDGTHMAALHLSLAPGWKTYWRAPGDAGIPPQFYWDGSRNIGTMAVSWPTPLVFDQNGMRSVGYKDELVIPLHITPDTSGKDIRIKGEIELGVCKDICIPRSLKFDQWALTATTQPDAVIAAAMASGPYSADEAGVRSVTCSLSPIEGGLRLSATITMPSSGGTEIAVIEPGDPQIWASESVSKRSGDQLTAYSDLIHVSQSAFALDRSDVRITVLGGKHSVDIKGCTPG